MARGLAIATNFFNRMAAIDDFNALGKFAVSVGQREIVERNLPPSKAGWRTIDKCMQQIRAELGALGIEAPPNPSAKEQPK
jgi:hypothetical protein